MKVSLPSLRNTLQSNVCEIINTIPEGEFFEYFNENIYPMSADEKRNYMGT